MENDKASRTALATAIQRALHQLYDDDPKVFTDSLGVRMADGIDSALFATIRDGRTEPPFMLIRAHVVLRSRFAEDELARMVPHGVQQYVLLGAGLDTFAFRQPPFARDIRIFEVDHPATQAWKRRRVTSMGLPEPSNLCWTPVDFERQSLLK
jgi:methyltransferase (TIGR00027 family)